jgi:hypothetical protein
MAAMPVIVLIPPSPLRLKTAIRLPQFFLLTPVTERHGLLQLLTIRHPRVRFSTFFHTPMSVHICFTEIA